MFLGFIVSRNSCLFYGLQVNVAITDITVCKALTFQALFNSVEFSLVLITENVFTFAHF